MIGEENQVSDPQSPTVDPSTVQPETQGKPLGEVELNELELNGDVAAPSQEDGLADAATPLDAGIAEANQAAIAEYRATIAKLEEELNALKAQLDDRTTQYMRIAADFDNFRKRTQREKEEIDLQIKCATINELLPVVDNFERARSQIKPQTDQETSIHKSYQNVYKQLVECLKRIGVSPMRAEGKEFDPNLHEAVMRQPTDEYPEGTVMEELQRGYMLGERILRHALVKVAATPEPVISSEQAEPDPSAN